MITFDLQLTAMMLVCFIGTGFVAACAIMHWRETRPAARAEAAARRVQRAARPKRVR